MYAYVLKQKDLINSMSLRNVQNHSIIGTPILWLYLYNSVNATVHAHNSTSYHAALNTSFWLHYEKRFRFSTLQRGTVEDPTAMCKSESVFWFWTVPLKTTILVTFSSLLFTVNGPRCLCALLQLVKISSYKSVL